MKNVRDVYSIDDDENGYGNWYDYDTLVNTFEYETLFSEDSGSYQGNSYYLLKDHATGMYGYLVFGWGSCSGCDSLQACSSLEDLEELQQHLHQGIVWKDSAAELLQYLESKDFDVEYYDAPQELLTKAREILV